MQDARIHIEIFESIVDTIHHDSKIGEAFLLIWTEFGIGSGFSDDMFEETERMNAKLELARNRYMNEALALYD